MIRFEGVKYAAEGEDPLYDVTLEVERGNFLALTGAKGAGSRSLLRMINRLAVPDEGKIYIEGKDIAQENLEELRRNIGYVTRTIDLFPNLCVAENISLVPKLNGASQRECEQIAREMLQKAQLPVAELINSYPVDLSKQQKQWVALLRALAMKPSILLLDEPFADFDPVARAGFWEEIKRLQKENDLTIVLATEDVGEAFTTADQVALMGRGRLLQQGNPHDIFMHPENDQVRQLLDRYSPGDIHGPRKAADFMRSSIYKVYKNKGVREAIEAMARRGIDSLLVMNEDGTFAGTVSIRRIRDEGRSHDDIEPLISRDDVICYVDDDARECFDLLLDSGKNYVVVLNKDKTIAGIITKTSMARAMAGAIWATEGGEV